MAEPPRTKGAWPRGGTSVAAAVLALLTCLAAVFAVPAPARAATGCRVVYSVAPWSGGFTGDLTVTNLGDPITGWTLEWDFSLAGVTVLQGWNGVFSQNGSHVFVTSTAEDGALDTGASIRPGFNGAWAGAAPVLTGFKLNGVICTGTVHSPAAAHDHMHPSASGSAPSAVPSPPPAREPSRSREKPSPVREAAPSPAREPSRSPDVASSPEPEPSPQAEPSPVPAEGRSPTPSREAADDAWRPPAELAGPLEEVWRHVESTYANLHQFRNYGWDQVMANGGSLNYCVRWDSTAKVSAKLRDEIHAALARSVQKWIDVLVEDGQGWNGWPYQEVAVKVVGWAVRDRALLEWTDDSVDIYVGDLNENAPQCAPPCGRVFNQTGDYSRCPGGAARHYDMSLWLTEGMQGGSGGDWGQRIGSEYMVHSVHMENIHILLHEMGHTFGLDDFYDWSPPGVGGFIMKAGSANQITEFDKWMFRDWWRHLKSRYGR